MEAEVATTVESTVDVVQRVTTDMSPADVVSTLTPASQQMGSASNGISVLIAELDGLKSEIAEALRGGQPGPLVGLLDLIRRGLIEVMASLGAANQRTDETIAEARQTGNF
jgi:methyl-accepting chemotaxis protein